MTAKYPTGTRAARLRLYRAAAVLGLLYLAAANLGCSDGCKGNDCMPMPTTPTCLNVAGAWTLTSVARSATPAGNCWADFLIGVMGQTSSPIRLTVQQTGCSITVTPDSSGLPANATICITAGTVTDTTVSTHLVSCSPASATVSGCPRAPTSLKVQLTALDTSGTFSANGTRVDATSLATWSTSDAVTGASTGQVSATLGFTVTR